MKRILIPAAALLLLAGCASKTEQARPDYFNRRHSTDGSFAPVAPPPPTEIVAAPVTPPAPAPKEEAKEPNPKREALVAKLEKNFFEDQRFADAKWGVLVMSAETGEIWFERNADELFIPASNQKVPSALSALTYLGPDFRYETTVGHTGEIVDGVLKGNLVVFGQGDPTYYNKWHTDSRAPFWEWAEVLKSKGITKIEGDIIGDDNAWDDTHTGFGWPERGLTDWYWAEYGALNFNENYVDIMIHPPAEVGGEVRLEPNVPSSYFELVNNIEVVAEGSNSVSLNRENGSNQIILGGKVRAGSSAFEETPTITNPTKFFVTVLKESLEEKGIEVTGSPVDVDDLGSWDRTPKNTEVLHIHKSAPLSEILAMLFKRSQNSYAETMPYTMGWKASGLGTFDNGRKVVQQEMKKLGVEPNEYEYMDGSGLTRHNRLSPRVVSRIYYNMQENKLFQYWWDMQSIAGVDGTLRTRMRGTKAENNMRGKTGTLNGVRALSGYVQSAAGERLIVSFLVNNHNASNDAVNQVTDGAAAMLAEYDGK